MSKALDRFLAPPPKNLGYNLDYLQRHVYQYYKNGLSVVPLEGIRPAVNPEEYTKRRPTPEEIRGWWGVNVNGSDIHEIYGKSENRYGVGIICGSVSGNLIALSFNDLEMFRQFFIALASHATVNGEGIVRMSYHFIGRAWVMRDEGVKVLLRIKGNALARFPSKVDKEIRDSEFPYAFNGAKVLGEGNFIVAPPSTVSEKYEADWRADITNPVAAVTASELTMLMKIIEKLSKGEALADDDFSITGSLFPELGLSSETKAKKEPEKPPKEAKPEKGQRGQNSLLAFLDETGSEGQ